MGKNFFRIKSDIDDCDYSSYIMTDLEYSEVMDIIEEGKEEYRRSGEDWYECIEEALRKSGKVTFVDCDEIEC